VRVQLAIDSTPQLRGGLTTTLGESLAARAATVLGAIWHIETATAAPKLRDHLLGRIKVLSADDVVAALPSEDLTADKLYLAAIASRDSELTIAVREFDCRTRQLGLLIERTAPGIPGLAAALWDAVLESFTPLARIELVEENRVTARLRAGGLVTDQASPALVEAEMVLQPILRRTERSGQLAKGGIQVVPWTLLAVSGREGSLLDCVLHSGYRAALPARANSRVERLALLVKPRWHQTRLQLIARDNPNKPLFGYEVHIRADGEEKTTLLGATDALGQFELERGDGALQILFIKNGRQLLAKLPIVPGHEEQVVAKLPDDDKRLEAEGFIAALASRAVDLVARREILATRIRARVKAGRVAEAQQLLDEFRKLETRADLNRDLNQFRQRVTATDSLTRSRIDKLFAETQRLLLLKALSDEPLAELTRELTQARGVE
jgi:hypothetical protein